MLEGGTQLPPLQPKQPVVSQVQTDDPRQPGLPPQQSLLPPGQPVVCTVQPRPILLFNWLHFKPES